MLTEVLWYIIDGYKASDLIADDSLDEKHVVRQVQRVSPTLQTKTVAGSAGSRGPQARSAQHSFTEGLKTQVALRGVHVAVGAGVVVGAVGKACVDVTGCVYGRRDHTTIRYNARRCMPHKHAP